MNGMTFLRFRNRMCSAQLALDRIILTSTNNEVLVALIRRKINEAENRMENYIEAHKFSNSVVW